MAMTGQAIFNGRTIGDGDGEMSFPEKRMMFMLGGPQPELPYPLRKLETAWGKPEMEYIIPNVDRQRVLEELYLFVGIPKLDDELFDVHEQKTFRVRDFRVIRWRGANLLASPYFPLSGGLLVDWVELGKENKVIVLSVARKEARNGK